MPADLLQVEENRFNRIIAISDLHGDLKALNALLEATLPTSEDLIVTIGDYVNRGPNSCGVLQRLIELHASDAVNIISLRGNHDQMMIDASQDPQDLDFWLQFGGQSTLASYPEERIDSVPESHWHFLIKTCCDLVVTKSYLFVHGHLNPSDAVELQDIQTLHWCSYYQSDAHCSGRTIVCGHRSTPSNKPESLGHTLAIETKKFVNAVEIVSQTYWQADKRGEITAGRI